MISTARQTEQVDNACPRDIHEEIDKLVFLRELGAGDWDLGALPAQRVTTLARWVQAASNHG